jgi:hypothetical protein
MIINFQYSKLLDNQRYKTVNDVNRLFMVLTVLLIELKLFFKKNINTEQFKLFY